MLKKSGIILLLLLYIATVPGFALNLHYCGKKIASVKIDLPAKKCGPTEAKSKMKCCQDKQIDVKVKDVHQAEKSTSIFAKLFSFDMPALPFEDFILSSQKALSQKLFDRGPPPPDKAAKVPVFIKNCNLRI
ncbi:hypothetical protein GCM10023149_34220 [Mucilaginibacter gynuensis]|uniref:Uncharacterized protein n=1 Tax=Mucilaginibacter gynuensis TaxID=1302236 RepID=A0ABP8GT29_9SPHI